MRIRKPTYRELKERLAEAEAAIAALRDEEVDAVVSQQHVLLLRLEEVERALRESEEFSSSLLANSPNPILVINPDTSIRYMNQATEKLTGFSKAEILGTRAPYPWWTEETLNKIEKDFEEAVLKGRGAYKLWELFQTKTGRRFWVEVSWTCIKGNGESNYCLANWVDITERKRIEERLFFEASVNEAIADLSSALILPKPIEDISFAVLEHAKRLTSSEFGYTSHIDLKTGYHIASTMTRDIWDICRIENKDIVFKDFTGLWGWVLNKRKPLMTNDPSNDRRSSGTPEGHLPIRRFLSVPALVGGTLVGQIALANSDHDYTERDLAVVERLAALYAIALQRKRGEDELQKAHGELERRVVERTAELKQEIKERKQTEEVLLETKELLERVFSSIDLMVAYMDTDFNFIRVNRSYAEADDRTPEFFVGKNHFALYPNEENEAIFRKVVEMGEPYFTFEKPFEYAEHPERGITYWDWSLQPVKDRGGKVSGVVLSMVNVTERKLAQEARRESEFRYRSLFQDSRDAVYITTRDGKFIDMNQSTMDIFGYPREELMRMDIRKLYVHPEDRNRFQEVIEREGFVRDYEIKFLKKDGTELDCLSTATIRRADDGTILGYQGIIRDITDRKKADEALRESEKQLRYLSSQLLSAQESERKRIARELHDGIGQSMSAIKFSVENTIRHREKSTTGEDIQSLKALIPLIQASIEEVRKIGMALRPSTLDDLGILATISWFCREFQTIYSGIRVEKQIEIQEDEMPDTLKTIIYRVLQESLNNVAKHSEADHVSLFLRKTKGGLELAIEDNGVGFDLEDALSVESSKRGLGLASMRERTELSGGSFIIQSTKGEGTVVRALWPVFL
jgi:PAS domain S-box-containing protein